MLSNIDIKDMATSNSDLLKGTVDLLILKVLSTGMMHGWDISKRIEAVSNKRILVKQGSLYPALHRLENRALIEAEWGVSDAGRSAKFYKLTKTGRASLGEETAEWKQFVECVSAILRLDESIA